MSSPTQEDPNAKADLRGFQPGFLAECKRALDAGFPPAEGDPVYIDTDDQEAVDEVWSSALTPEQAGLPKSEEDAS